MGSLSSTDRGAGLRFHRRGVEQCGAPTEIRCDGETVSALIGESVASALTAHGIRKLCNSHEGDDRGLYCGMGVCFDCRVTINGRPGQRACLTPIEPGIAIETASHVSPQPSYAQRAAADGEERCSILIIGAGPAGLAAAEEAARNGVDVVVLDERPYPGGQYYKPLAPSHRFKNGRPSDRQFGDGLDRVRRVKELGVRICSNTLVWDVQVEPDGAIAVRALDGERSVNWAARKLIIATGAFERAWPVPGWTLPGVITTGAAQTLARSYQTAPGKRVLFAGNGPLNLQVAADLVAADVEVVGVAESAPRPSFTRIADAWADAWAMLRTRPDLVWQGIRYLAQLKRQGVPILYGSVLVRVEGAKRAERAIVAKIDDSGTPIAGSEIAFDVDAVCLGYGFSPASEIGRLAGCEHVVDRRFGNVLVANRHTDGRTSHPDIFVAGDAGGPWGAHSAIAQGALAGRSAARDIVAPNSAVTDAALAKRLARERTFQRALWRIFAAPKHVPASVDDRTVACRCENVQYGAIRSAIAQGAFDIPAVKRQTRCGMGRCQGRYCAPIVATLLEDTAATALNSSTFSRMQPPVRPVGLRAIAVPQETAPNPGPGGIVSVARPDIALPDVQLGTADVVVVGAGGVGLFTARELVRSGRSVIVVERRMPFAEASGANAGNLHVQFQAFGFTDLCSEVARRAALTLPMQVDSVHLWKDFAQSTDIDIEVDLDGGLTVAADSTSLRHLEEKVAIERAAGLRIDLISGDEARKRLPYLSEKIIAASYSADEGKINPMHAARAVLNAALEAGVRIDTQTTVYALEASDGGFVVRTDRGFYRAGQVVNAAGAWCGMIAAMVGDSMPVRQNPIQMLVSEPTSVKIPYHLAHARQRLTLKQAAAGNLVIGGGWRASTAEDPALARPTRNGLGGNLAAMLEILPGFGDLQMIRSWTGTAFTTQPIISPSPSSAGLFHVVTQNAMTLAPVLGRTAANMVLGRKPDYDLAPFALTRSATAPAKCASRSD